MTKEQFKARTNRFALRVLRVVNALPNTVRGNLIGNQLFLSGTLVAANYRKALISKNKFEFTTKLEGVGEASNESAFWLEMIIASEMLKSESVAPLLDEANYISALIEFSKKSSKFNNDHLMNKVMQ